MLRPAQLFALGVAGLLACTATAPVPAAPESAAPIPAAPEATAPDPVSDTAWSVITQDLHLPGLGFARATHDFRGRLELPRSSVSESMMAGPAVVVARDGIFFAGRPVTTIENGEIVGLDRTNEHLIPALHELLQGDLKVHAVADAARGEPPAQMVTLFVDQDTPFGVLLAVLYTSGRAGAVEYQFAVTPTGPPATLGSDVLRVSPPKYSVDVPGQTLPPAPKLQLVMMVSRTDIRIGRHVPHAPRRSAWLERISLGDDRESAMQRITELARVVAAEEQWGAMDLPDVLVGAEQDVPFELLIAALVAVAGPDCVIEDFYGERPHRCLFAGRVLHGGSPAPPELERP